ncbi:hypothetical protein [Streptomonospora litoralis]|uniref:Uncharacterized protein n=1 Tax=Streptomonospora litoralis TaxID=2498135 RepID=A0A4V0ZJG9_9ACTN|nr:hypothetical protein [Streptomonospora litoralis]QBI53442.1 hypothetical protein EKD16_08240 [Streptomonospora litoralis]
MSEAHPEKPRTTAETLGAYRQELIDAGVREDTAETLMQMVAPTELHEVTVQPPDPEALGSVGVRLVPQFDHDEVAREGERARALFEQAAQRGQTEGPL